ncbi:MAG: excalibur calcium-binding domain-containing protein [Sulfuricurvum sp.]|nr:excalibur calcium-binding domain-containing protein [Sulfuricurvum sp.]
MPKFARIVISFLLIFAVTSIYAECTATTSEAIADKIAHGHAWVNHADEYSEKKVIAGLEMPEALKVTTVEEFKAHILSVMLSTISRPLPSERVVYWDSETGTIIFYDPISNDCGTAFRPSDGKPYYNRVVVSEKPREKYIFNKSKQQQIHQASSKVVEKLITSTTKKSSNSNQFTCDGRTYCSQMRSCEEATFFLKNCTGMKVDGNNDGIPCEKQWCN